MIQRIKGRAVLAAVAVHVALFGAGRLSAAPQVPTRTFEGAPMGKVVDELAARFGVTITVSENLRARELNGTVAAVDLPAILRILAEMVEGEVYQKEEGWFMIREVPRITYSTAGEGEDIKTVIQAIALSAGANVFVSPNVQGRVLMQASGIPWKRALQDAIRTAGDFAMVEEPGGVIRIVEAAVLLSQVETEVFRLRYLLPPSDYEPSARSVTIAIKREYKGKGNQDFKDPAAALSDFALIKVLQNVLTPNVGKLDYDPSTNALIVRDIRPRIEEVRKIIAQLDVQPSQVFVDVNFVKTADTDFLDYGVDWGDTGPVASASGSRMYTPLPYNLGGSGLTSTLGLYRENTLDSGGRATEVDNFLRHRVSDTRPHAFEFGVIDFSGVQAVLRFVKRDVKSKVVQAPKIATLDREKATIFVGDTVRFAHTVASSSQSGTLTFSLQEADSSPVQTGFQLLIVPHIIPGTDQIRMTVIPTSNTLSGTSTTKPGFDTYTSGSQTIDLPRITSRTVVTDVLLDSGQAVVIGGLLETNDAEEVTKLPILGDIPILEYLFKNRNRTYTVDNLLIFIRPEIVRNLKDASAEVEKVSRRGVWDIRVDKEGGLAKEPEKEKGQPGATPKKGSK